MRLWQSTPDKSPADVAAFEVDDSNLWEQIAVRIYDVRADPSCVSNFVQCVSLLRVSVPALVSAAAAKVVYPLAAMQIAGWIDGDDGVFAVVAQDASQYIQNVLTTSGLVFSILVGQTYYFMVRGASGYRQLDAVCRQAMPLHNFAHIRSFATCLFGVGGDAVSTAGKDLPGAL